MLRWQLTILDAVMNAAELNSDSSWLNSSKSLKFKTGKKTAIVFGVIAELSKRTMEQVPEQIGAEYFSVAKS